MKLKRLQARSGQESRLKAAANGKRRRPPQHRMHTKG
jgi:hypothetical protein